MDFLSDTVQTFVVQFNNRCVRASTYFFGRFKGIAKNISFQLSSGVHLELYLLKLAKISGAARALRPVLLPRAHAQG